MGKSKYSRVRFGIQLILINMKWSGNMLYEIVNDFPHEIIYEKEGPCISLYQPTHRHRPENKQDPIRFKNLLVEIENSLKQKYSKEEISSLMKPLNEIAEDNMFWNYTNDGLAILANKNKCIVYKLQRTVDEIAVVADSFHIKPLIRVFQSADRFYLLELNRKEFKLYEGTRYGLEEVKFSEDTPTTLVEVLGDDFTDPHLNASSYGGVGSSPMFHGHGGRKDEIDIDTERFFRYVDRFVLENYSKPTGLPLILAALDEYHSIFREVSHNSLLMEIGIKSSFETLKPEELKDEAWKVMEPFYLEKTKKLVDRYEFEKSKFLGSDDLAQVAVAANESRIDTLLVESDRVIPGKINKENGRIIDKELDNPEVDDLLDDLVEMVFNSKGHVVLLPKERMPSTTGVAAIYRY